jgi:UDP-2,3-diacylglucosamine pyrophosphatase LpxH
MIYTKCVLPYSDDNKTIKIVFTSCQHYGSNNFSRRRFKNFLSDNLQDQNSYLILLGDIFDAIVASDKKRYDYNLIDHTYLNKNERPINLALKDCISDLLPYKDRILGCCSGNHEWQFSKRYDFDITQLLCESLNCKNLGMSFLMKLILRRNGNKERTRSVNIYGHHGYGGSSTIGGSITKYERKSREFDADIYCFGHDHKSWDIKLPRVGINNNGKPYDRSVLILCCGTFKKSLSNDENTTWEESRGFSPSILGGKVVEITAISNGNVRIECVI